MEIFFDFPAVLFGFGVFRVLYERGESDNTMQRVAYINIYIMM